MDVFLVFKITLLILFYPKIFSDDISIDPECRIPPRNFISGKSGIELI